MLSELQKANINSVFDVLDTDGSGVLTRRDFEVVSENLAKVLGHPADSAPARAVAAGYLGWWEQIRGQVDADRDGRVDRDEYVAAVDRGLLEDEHYLDAVSTAADNLFDAADTNGDGTLGETELVAIYGAVGVAADVAGGAFQQIDTDGDGKISKDELRTMVRGVFASKGPEEPGANALGNA